MGFFSAIYSTQYQLQHLKCERMNSFYFRDISEKICQNIWFFDPLFEIRCNLLILLNWNIPLWSRLILIENIVGALEKKCFFFVLWQYVYTIHIFFSKKAFGKLTHNWKMQKLMFGGTWILIMDLIYRISPTHHESKMLSTIRKWIINEYIG